MASDCGSAASSLPITASTARVSALTWALPQSLAIEGHTDAAPFGKDHTYTNWELSTDRANAARRIMEESGLPPSRVKAIRGFADTILRTPGEPFNPRNRRVSIVVQNDSGPAPLKAAGTAPGAPGAAAPEAHAPAKADAHATH